MARRRTILWIGAATAIVILLVAGLTVGELAITPGEALAALFGAGERGTSVIVLEWRLPRLVMGALLGAALGLSGALFQIITRNPLGSPDVLGFSTGAFTGALVVMLGSISGYFATAIGALIGGLVTAAIVWLLVIRRGAAGFRLIVAGIGITALINAVNTVMITGADDRDALSAAIWGAGSLNGVESFWIAPSLVVLLLCALATAWLHPALTLHELGDDTSTSLGARSSRLRLFAMLIGVVLVAFATAVAGPIAFVALAAPQIARRLWITGPVPLTASAVSGAVLLMASDLVAQRILAPTILPTGIVTICLGGLYLVWALARRGRLT
ncbi:FecCD family ABC transporter permease [Compostimonas suwonensis]|uniref:FecCD family ABC transporter permease n=1 Tax=Compostimonas suwonensis TaxID=1048394 RepID=UPI00147400B6|nr:iron chelate uptake ABC transporter family permease subunit [Compostimonas suwonensis]